MRRILTLVLAFVAIGATAQNKDYIYPLVNVQGNCVANFGEIRPGHFHAGVDIRTDGVEGKRVVAVADGYVSRIVIQGDGYGIGLYLKMKDGSVAVYGHLQRFRDDIEQFARKERFRKKSNTLDCSFDSARWPVKQGDLLAYSGNTGSSFGPHLHFEIRTPGKEVRLNLVKEGIIRVKDNLPPKILRLRYVETDTLSNGICTRSSMEDYDVLRRPDGCHLAQGDTISVGRKGYFVLEVSDRRNGVNNRFGIWRLTAKKDGVPYFEYRMNGFDYNEGRMSDAVSCYPLQIKARCEVIRIAQLEKAPDLFYPVMVERGLVRCDQGAMHRIDFEVEDDSGNISELSVAIRGRKTSFQAEDEECEVLDPVLGGEFREGDWASVVIPPHSVYEKTPIKVQSKAVPQTKSAGLKILSDAVCFVDERVPMLHWATYRLKHPVPQNLEAHTVLGRWSDGRLKYVGGHYRNGEVKTRSRSGGWMVLVADTEAPKIYPRYPKARVSGVADLHRQSRIVFRVTDNFSGVSSYTMHIDGVWVPTDRQPVKGEYSYRFVVPSSGKMHNVSLTVKDGAGNAKTYQGKFFR